MLPFRNLFAAQRGKREQTTSEPENENTVKAERGAVPQAESCILDLLSAQQGETIVSSVGPS